jgi:hypothetical protein
MSPRFRSGLAALGELGPTAAVADADEAISLRGNLGSGEDIRLMWSRLQGIRLVVL